MLFLGNVRCFLERGFLPYAFLVAALWAPWFQLSSQLWLTRRGLWVMKEPIRTKHKPKFLLGTKATCSMKFSSLTTAAGVWGFFFGFALFFCKSLEIGRDLLKLSAQSSGCGFSAHTRVACLIVRRTRSDLSQNQTLELLQAGSKSSPSNCFRTFSTDCFSFTLNVRNKQTGKKRHTIQLRPVSLLMVLFALLSPQAPSQVWC